MSRKISRLSDISDAPGAETYTFAIDGIEYEIDLLDSEWGRLLDTLGVYIDNARALSDRVVIDYRDIAR